jgi:hypothetical protein
MKAQQPSAPSYFFRIELAEDSMSGWSRAPASLKRLKMLFSRMHLSMGALSLTPLSLFQNMIALTCLSGGVLKWTSLVRIRHLTTMALLGLSDTDGRAYLTNDSRDPATVFRLLSDLEVKITLWG